MEHMRTLALVPVALALTMASPSTARACSINNPPDYISVEIGPHDIWGGQAFVTPIDGAALFTMAMTQTSFEHAFSAVSVIVRDPEGVEIPGALEQLPLYESGLEHDAGSGGGMALLIWHPQVLLAPTTAYSAEFSVDTLALTGEPDWEGEDVSVTMQAFTTTDSVAAELALPDGIELELTTYVASILERLCCEMTADSCGVAWVCETSRQRVEPALQVSAVSTPLTYLWTAPVDAEGNVGAVRTVQERFRGSYIYDPEVTNLHELADLIELTGAQEEYCVVVGATSLISGQSVISETMCVPHGDLEAPVEEDVAWSFLHGVDACLTPLVYESTNEPYEPAGGCRIDVEDRGRTTLGLVFVLALFSLRRRRRGSLS